MREWHEYGPVAWLRQVVVSLQGDGVGLVVDEVDVEAVLVVDFEQDVGRWRWRLAGGWRQRWRR